MFCRFTDVIAMGVNDVAHEFGVDTQTTDVIKKGQCSGMDRVAQSHLAEKKTPVGKKVACQHDVKREIILLYC